MKKLQDKVAIITGCARGIGKATALLFAENGAKLLINDLNDEIDTLHKELNAMGCENVVFKGNVAEFDAVEQLTAKAVETFGRIDILINTVALPHRKSIMDTPVEEFDRIVNVNMKAVFYPCKAVIPHMINQKYGKIVNISSVAGIRGGGLLGKSSYAASKAGVTGLSKGIAREVAPYGITCNVVCPGFTNTPRNSEESEDNIKRVISNTPLGRPGEAAEVAPVIMMLASDDSSFITGTVSVVDGGITMI